MPSTAAVLKTATMHSLIMTNARGDLISRLCHESKIPQTRWRFLPGIRSKAHACRHTSTRALTDKPHSHRKQNKTKTRAFNASDFTYMREFTEEVPTIVIFCDSRHQVEHINAIRPLKKDIAFSTRVSLRCRNAQKWTFGSSCHVRLSRQCPEPKTFNWKTC